MSWPKSHAKSAKHRMPGCLRKSFVSTSHNHHRLCGCFLFCFILFKVFFLFFLFLFFVLFFLHFSKKNRTCVPEFPGCTETKDLRLMLVRQTQLDLSPDTGHTTDQNLMHECTNFAPTRVSLQATKISKNFVHSLFLQKLNVFVQRQVGPSKSKEVKKSWGMYSSYPSCVNLPA